MIYLSKQNNHIGAMCESGKWNGLKSLWSNMHYLWYQLYFSKMRKRMIREVLFRIVVQDSFHAFGYTLENIII